MKNVSETFKEAIKQYGRQIDVIIEYTENGVEKFLDVDTLFSVTPIVNANLLKSVMKQLNFESSVRVEKNTWVTVRFGVVIDKALTVQDIHRMRVDRLNSTEVKLLQGFEYINLGHYIVAEEPEYNADTFSYSHKCFDRMIFAMQNYEVLNIEYPITLKNFLYAVANKLNINVKNADFYNQNREIQKELYEGLEYTYRDVLDEIAQATGSIICINDNDELEVRYLNNTNETIDEDFLKDVNVTMKEKYGTINTIVLSRSAGTDNIYYPETLPENPVEIKISDNQIMNWNDRSDYLPELYQALNGIEYYVNDFKSTGITYLEVGDKYNVQIGENTYNCVLLNDEIDITQGLEEQVYTEMPEQSQTDYKKADKTDQKINQTNLTVDKQNQQINATITRVENNEENISNLLIDVDGIHTEVSKKVGENEIISKINQSAEAVSIDANKISLNGKNINLTGENVTISSNNFNVDKYGNMSCSNANITGGNINMLGDDTTPTIKIRDYSGNEIEMYPSNFYMTYNYFGEIVSQYFQKGGYYVENESTGESTTVWYDGITTPTVTQTSKEEDKKNFEKFEGGLEEVLKTDIYKYHLKNQADGDKKHIGFVIGKNYNYSDKITTVNKDGKEIGVDTYAMISVLWKAVQELNEEIEELKKKGGIK